MSINNSDTEQAPLHSAGIEKVIRNGIENGSTTKADNDAIDGDWKLTSHNSSNSTSPKPSSPTPDESEVRQRHFSNDDHVKARSRLFDSFRPRSKSDASKAVSRKSVLLSPTKQVTTPSGGSNSTPVTPNPCTTGGKPISPLANASTIQSTFSPEKEFRGRSGSESHKGRVSKMMDIFRTKSNTLHRSLDETEAEKKTNKCKMANLSIPPYLQSESNRSTPLHAVHSSRQRANSLSTPHRASDIQIDCEYSNILFRDARGLPVDDPFFASDVSAESSSKDDSAIFVDFFKYHRCYDLVPTSAKLVIFDTQLLVKKAFFALVYNGVRAAPLWNSKERKIVGMLTITDFINILRKYYGTPTVEKEKLEEHKLETWQQDFVKTPLIYVEPDTSLYESIETLAKNNIHRLPVIDPENGDVLYILTYKRLLRFLFLYIRGINKPDYCNKSIEELGIGTYENIETATPETTIIEALDKFQTRRISALPIVNSDGRLVDIYAKFDVINLAAEKTYSDLDITLEKANEKRNEWFEGVYKCTLDETFYTIMERINNAEVHRLVVVDSQDRVIGIVSLSDILKYLITYDRDFDDTKNVSSWENCAIPECEEPVSTEFATTPFSTSPSSTFLLNNMIDTLHQYGTLRSGNPANNILSPEQPVADSDPENSSSKSEAKLNSKNFFQNGYCDSVHEIPVAISDF